IEATKPRCRVATAAGACWAKSTLNLSSSTRAVSTAGAAKMARTRRCSASCSASCSAWGAASLTVADRWVWPRWKAGALELQAHGIDEPAMVVGHDQIDSRKATAVEPDQGGAPTALGFAVAALSPPDLAVARFIDAHRDEGAACAYPPVFTDLEDERIDEHERGALLGEGTLIAGSDQRIEPVAPVGDRR